MPLRRLLPLLFCPLCAVDDGSTPRPLLRHPFTLHCGHTVCLSHLETLDPAQRCPLPVCSSAPNPNTARPNIPTSSRVIYVPAGPPPAPAQQSAPTSANQFDQRVDITISKLIDVVSRHSQPPPSPPNQGDSDLSDEDVHPELPPPPPTLPSSDDETEFPVALDLSRSSGHRRSRRPAPELASHPTTASSTTIVSADYVDDVLPSSSGQAGQSRTSPPRTGGGGSSDGSDLGPEPPKKRPRRDTRSFVTDQETQSCAIEPEAETGNPENPNSPQPTRLDAESRQDPEGGGENLRARVEKELLTELNCEICFAIYYQPVTTPCQHVSRPLLFRTFPCCFVIFLRVRSGGF